MILSGQIKYRSVAAHQKLPFTAEAILIDRAYGMNDVFARLNSE